MRNYISLIDKSFDQNWFIDINSDETVFEKNKYQMNYLYSYENEKNNSRTKSLDLAEDEKPIRIDDEQYKDYCELIYKMIKRDTFEIGYDNETTRFIRTEVKKDRDYVLKALQQVITEYSKDDGIWIAILYILSDLTYEESEPYGIFVAGSCLSKKNIQIKEMAIMLFEQWANDVALDFLSDMETGVNWLDSYITTVIEDIKLEMKTDGLSC